mgnify:CR=1 FL=1
MSIILDSSREKALFNGIQREDGPLWQRIYGSEQLIHDRSADNRLFCSSVEQNIKKFCTGIDCDVKNIKVIIGLQYENLFGRLILFLIRM